jgi:hypothetical protein
MKTGYGTNVPCFFMRAKGRSYNLSALAMASPKPNMPLAACYAVGSPDIAHLNPVFTGFAAFERLIEILHVLESRIESPPFPSCRHAHQKGIFDGFGTSSPDCSSPLS